MLRELDQDDPGMRRRETLPIGHVVILRHNYGPMALRVRKDLTVRSSPQSNSIGMLSLPANGL
jgi:hypothetical protein